jgi:hypothetical protein
MNQLNNKGNTHDYWLIYYTSNRFNSYYEKWYRINNMRDIENYIEKTKEGYWEWCEIDGKLTQKEFYI